MAQYYVRYLDWLPLHPALNLVRYRRKNQVSAIIYLHRITDNRLSGSAARNLRMFGKLVGQERAPNVVMVSTMWDAISEARRSIAEARLEQLKEEYWKPVLEKGATHMPFDNTPKTAWDIITKCYETQRNSSSLRPDNPLLLQRQVVDDKLRLNESEAAKELYNTYQLLLGRQKEQLQHLIDNQSEEADKEMLRVQLAETELRLEKTFSDLHCLKIPLVRRIKLFFRPRSNSR